MFIPAEAWPSAGTHHEDPLSSYRAPFRRLVLAHSCRVAFDLALDALRIQPGDEVLVPAFRDGSQSAVAKRRGVVPVAYRVDDQLRADLADVANRMGPRTRALYLIHYLGWPNQPREAQALCAQRGIRLIEDCAHALFSKAHGKLLGTFGDVAVASLWKVFGLPDGGLLMLNRPELPDPPALPRPALRPLLVRAARISALSLLPDCVLRPALRQAARRALRSPGKGVQYNGRREGMSEWSQRLMQRTDPDAQRHALLRAFRQLADEWPAAEWATPLNRTAEPDVCPRVFAVMCSDRERAIAPLIDGGVMAYRMWNHLGDGDPGPEFPEARRLKAGVIAIPLREGLDSPSISHIMSCIRRNAYEGHRTDNSGSRDRNVRSV